MTSRGALLGAASLAAVALAALATCGGPAPSVAPRPGPPPRRAIVLADPPRRYTPSPASVRDNAQIPGDALTAVDRCGVCHADVFEQWSASAHRFSSLDNPFYLPAFLAARHDRGVAVTRWCGGCHDPALLFAGDLDGAPIDRTHERAQLGVGCVLCHSIERLHDRTGNGNYVVAPEPIPVPPRDRVDPAAVATHVSRAMRPVTRTAEFCGACHRVGLDEPVNGHRFLRGQDDFGQWDQSAYAGNDLERYDPGVQARTCQDCHMPAERAVHGDAAAARDGTVRSHRFLGGHTALAAWRGDADTMARERAMLRGAVRLDLFRAPDGSGEGAAPLEPAHVRSGQSVELDVVMVNESVGHRFPGGTADVADTWLEVTVTDARGERVAASGADGAPRAAAGQDDDVHRLAVVPLDEQGAPALLRDPHRFRAVVYDTTLPPRAARAVRYALAVPRDAQGPFTVRARLLHRRIAEPYWSFACARATADHGRPCPAPPVTEIAVCETTVTVAETAAVPRWQRFYDHGRALGEAIVQERVAQAVGSLRETARLAPTFAGAYVELARVSLREGRTDEAYALLDEARTRDPAAGAVPYLRGVAATDVWRFSDSVSPLESAHALVPRNVRAAEMLANALGITGRHDDALRVIAEGLAVDPERAQLHNLQALELDALGAPAEAEIARRAFMRYRAFDGAPPLRARCRREVPGCARESDPLHVHVLRPLR